MRDPDGGVSTADAEREPDREPDVEEALDVFEPDVRLVLAIRGNANKRGYECSGIPSRRKHDHRS